MLTDSISPQSRAVSVKEMGVVKSTDGIGSFSGVARTVKAFGKSFSEILNELKELPKPDISFTKFSDENAAKLGLSTISTVVPSAKYLLAAWTLFEMTRGVSGQQTAMPDASNSSSTQKSETSSNSGTLLIENKGFENTTSPAPPTQKPPIPISDLNDLKKIGKDLNYPLNETYLQTNDIDAHGFTPIGSSDQGFSGKYDGDNHKLANLNDCLFQKIEEPGEVKRVTISEGNIVITSTSENSNHGFVACEVESGGSVSEIKITKSEINKINSDSKDNYALNVGLVTGKGNAEKITVVDSKLQVSGSGDNNQHNACIGLITGLGDVKQSELSHSKMTVNNMNGCKAGMISGKGGVSNSSISFSTLTLKNSDHSHAGLAVGDGNAEYLNVSHSTVDASAAGLIIGASTGLGNTHDSTITNITLNIPDSENSFIGLVSGKGNIDSSRVIQSRLTANGNELRAAAGTACGNAINSIVNDTQLVFTKSDKSTLGIMTGIGDIKNSHVSHSMLTASGAQLKVAAGTGHGESQKSLIENSKVVLTDSTGSHAAIITGEGNIVNSSASHSSLTVSGNQLKAAVGTGQGNTTGTSVTYSSLTVTNTANSVLGGLTGQGIIANGLVDHFELTCSGAPVHAAAGSGIGSASNTSISNSKLLYQNNEGFNVAIHAAQNSPPRGNIGLLVAKGDIKNSSVISSSITANGLRVNVAAGTSEGNADSCIVADTHVSLQGSYRTYAGILTGKGNASNSEISRSSVKVGAHAPIVGAGSGYGYVDGLSVNHVKVLSNGQYSSAGIGVGVGSANKINATHSQVNVDGQYVEGAIGAANGIATNIYSESCQVSSSETYSTNIYLGIGAGIGTAENITSSNDKIISTVNNAKQGIGVGYGNAHYISSEQSSVTANGDHSYSAIGAGLGNATAITSNNSKVQVVGKYPLAGIGVAKGNATSVSDAHSTIVAKGNYAQAGVGSGTGRSINIKSEQSSVSVSDKQRLFGNPKLMYGEVSEPFAGIGVGKGDASDVCASGSTVSASGDKSSAGIGAGSGNADRVTSIHTRVSASGFKAAAGIGAGKGRSEHIVDTSSYVSASGQESSAGIGVGSGDAKHISSTQSKVSGRGDLFSASGIGAGRGTSNSVYTNNTTVTHSGKYCFAAVGTGKGSSTNITDISSQLKTTDKFCGVAIGSGSGSASKINANFSTIITDAGSSASIGTGDGYAYSVKACKCNINGIETNINCQTSTPLSPSDTSTSAPLVPTENTTLPSMTVPDEVTVDVGPNPLVLGIGVGTAAFIIGVPLGFCLISYAIAGLRDKKRGMELIRSPLTDAQKIWRFCRGGQSAVATEELEMQQPARAQPEAVL